MFIVYIFYVSILSSIESFNPELYVILFLFVCTVGVDWLYSLGENDSLIYLFQTKLFVKIDSAIKLLWIEADIVLR